ncbi:MAG: hypothetical protein H0T92_02530, partial [Pyrinomonadaceae bacterium]|nr:hypothetical protein [Pyrinomonadaceae bacterium]
FSSNNTWSAIAGQTVVGVVPVLGQVADARDIAAAAGDVYQGEEGGWARLGIAMVAIIPGLDFLKGGSRAGRRLLAEAAERSFSQVTEQGLQRLGTVLGREAVEQAEGELRVLAVSREEMLARLDTLLNSGNLSQNAQGSVRTAHNSLQNSFSQEDLIGALQDMHSMPVVINSRTYDHFREVRNTLDSLANARRSMLDDLDRVTPSTDRYRQLSQESEAILETIRRTEGFLNIR